MIRVFGQFYWRIFGDVSIKIDFFVAHYSILCFRFDMT